MAEQVDLKQEWCQGIVAFDRESGVPLKCNKPIPAESVWPDCCSGKCYSSLFKPGLVPVLGPKDSSSGKQRLYNLHKTLCDEALELMYKKNADYSAGSDDPFANFRGSSAFGVSPELGIIIRMQDKFMRVCAYLNSGQLQVKNESIRDIGHDLINYSVLLTAMLLQEDDNGRRD